MAGLAVPRSAPEDSDLEFPADCHPVSKCRSWNSDQGLLIESGICPPQQSMLRLRALLWVRGLGKSWWKRHNGCLQGQMLFNQAEKWTKDVAGAGKGVGRSWVMGK